jgi:hypothetical protein
MSKSINWNARIATEEAAEHRATLRTKLSERKQYKPEWRCMQHIAEAVSTRRRTLGNGNSETLDLTPSH